MKGDVNMSIKLIPNNEEKQKRYISITKANLNNNESQQKNSIIPSKTLVINELNVLNKLKFNEDIDFKITTVPGVLSDNKTIPKLNITAKEDINFDEELTLSILSGSIPSIEYETKVKNTFSANTTERILRTLISISMPENQPDDQSAKRPELPLTLLEMAFSYAALSGKTALSCEYIEQAVHHSNRLRKEIRTNFTCAL